MRFFGFFLFLALSYSSSAQVIFSEDVKIRVLMDQYEGLGKSEEFIEGWRIKLISTTNRREMENARYRLQRNYPDVLFTMSHENPYYSLKVGAFETRFDVEPLLAQFKEEFSGAIPFRDKIMKAELFAE